MPKRKRTDLAIEAEWRNQAQLARLGGDLRDARRRRRRTQGQVAAAAGIARSTVSAIERGHAGSHTLDTLQRVALASGRPLIVGLQRDPFEEPADAGHLGMQELVLRLGRRAGFAQSFELPTRASDPWRSIDVGLRDDRRRILIVAECWNSIGDIGAAARSTMRKVAEAEQYATTFWGTDPHLVQSVWIVRATSRNRALVGRYPAVFGTRFPGSSSRWLRRIAGSDASEALPLEPGLVWCDLAGTRLFAWRRHSGASGDRRRSPAD